MHVEDSASTRGHNHLIAGHGVISFAEVFKAMKHLGYQGDMRLELYPYVDAPEEAGKESLAFLQPIIAECWG